MSVLFTLVRLNDFTYSLYDCLFLFNIVSDYEFLVYYTNLWYILLALSFNTNIFILLGFNKKFRSIFLNYKRQLLQIKYQYFKSNSLIFHKELEHLLVPNNLQDKVLEIISIIFLFQ
jgi:hypothetical protein